MPATKWPEDGKPLDYCSIAKPIVKAIRFAYDLTRRNANKSIPWAGPPIGRMEAANSLEAKLRLSASMLRNNDEDQGRDALDEIIGVAIQLGIEQGRRCYKNSPSYKTLKIRMFNYKMGLERLASMEAFEGPRVINAEADKELLARIDYARKFVALKLLDGVNDDDND